MIKQLLVTALACTAATAQTAAPAEYHAMLTKYCVTCHNEKLKIPAGAPLALDKADLDHVTADPVVWEKVIRKLGVGAMPPQGVPVPILPRSRASKPGCPSHSTAPRTLNRIPAASPCTA